MSLAKVISGAQTGVDRGALDAALALHFPCGGTAPGRKIQLTPGGPPFTYAFAEDGRIDAEVWGLKVMLGGYRARTIANVRDADATLILCPRPQMVGGTAMTVGMCMTHKKPWLHIEPFIHEAETILDHTLEFIKTAAENHGHPVTLNVAGPRASKWKDGYQFAFDFVTCVIDRIGAARQTAA